MQLAKKLMMLTLAVNDMPKAKEFYTEKLGLEVKIDYRQDDENWWVELVLPEGDVHITLTTHLGKNLKPGAVVIYFATSDIDAAHKELSDKGLKVSDVADDLHGPGSGTKWFNFEDTEGNLVHLEQV